MNTSLNRVNQFMNRYGLRLPVLMAPMAGACPPGLARSVAQAGGMGASGALLDTPDAIERWVHGFRDGASQDLPLQLNLWIPDPAPLRDHDHEAVVRSFLGQWGPMVSEDAYRDGAGPVFGEQVDALIAARPTVVSSIMGLYPPAVVDRLKAAGIAWFACVTTVDEARAAESAGADVVVAQGAEAGGHRGTFDAPHGAQRAAGLFALLPQVVDAVSVPVVATGGIADGRGIAAALMLGASAVQIGTALLRADESSVAAAWDEAIASSTPDGTRLTRAFSGRWGRAIASEYVLAANAVDAPEPAPYPVQRALTAGLRKQATEQNSIRTMQAWCGQSAGLARAGPAGELVDQWWMQARNLLGDSSAA